MTRNGRISCARLLWAVAFLLPTLSWAQLTTATISGTITDESGAVVPNATVSAIEISTGSVARAQASAVGFYVLNGLAPGRYRVRVEKEGFQAHVQEGIVVEVGRPVNVNIALQVGATTQAVTVAAVADQVNLRSQTVSYEVTTQMVTELPLNGRNILQLMQLAPDAGPTASSSYQQPASRPENANAYVGASGGRGNSTAFYLDGAVNEDALTEIANIFPNPDAIQEFSFATNTYSAKFAGRGGGVMNAVTRGGTNGFHGALFEFLRNSNLNARNFFSPTQDGLKRNQYGGTIGGPIRRDKSFFFFSYQGTNLRQTPASNSAVTPTAAQRAGDFSASRGNIVDPAGGAPFPGKQVPVSRFDPIAQKLLGWVPVGAPQTGVVFYTSRLVQNDKQFVVRMDQNVGEKFRIYASYLYDFLDQPSTTIPTNLLTATPAQSWTSQNFVLNATYLFRPNLLATFVGNISRRSDSYIGPSEFPGWPELGVQIPKLVTQGSMRSLNLTVGNYFNVSWNAFYTIPATSGDLGTHWSWVKGGHTIEFGAEVIKSKVIKNQDFQSDGNFTYSGALSGDNALDFLLSRPSSFTQREGYYYVPIRTLPAAYVADTWQVNRRLTLNLGLRWNPFVAMYDSSYHQAGVFSYDTYRAGTRSTLYPNLPPGLLVAGDPGIPNSIISSKYPLFTPRVGFAIDPFGTGKTSIRGGYGLYVDQMTANTLNPGYSPFTVNATFPFPASTENPYQGQFNPFPVPHPHPPSLTFPIPMNAQPFTWGMEPSFIQQWNFTIERQLRWSTLVRAAYEGQNADHLPGGIEGNAAVYNPALSAAANRQNVNARRPMGQYYQGLILSKNIGTSNFNALNISVEKRLSQGLTFLAGYRWSKCLDTVNENAATYTAYAYSSTNPRFDYGPCVYDVGQQFHFSSVWLLPSVKSMGFVGRHVLSGWEVNGLLTLRSGLPFTVTSGIDNSLSGIGLDHADIVGNPSLPGDRSKGDQLKQWFNTQAFVANALGTFGTSSRNLLRGPGFSNLDFSVVRWFPITKREAQKLQFRAEFFNVFNHANFNNPNSSVSSSSFGRITGAADPRIVQFSLKFVF